MEQTFYVNVLFGKNKKRIFDEMLQALQTQNTYRFQIHPFRINPINELSDKNGQNFTRDIRQHLTIMEDVKNSDIASANRPFSNVIFVNYTTQELEPALKFNRVKYYLCDYLNEDNIELVTMSTNMIYINFLKKAKYNKMPSLNSVFLNYSVLAFSDTNAAKRIGNPTTLDLGQETDDDAVYILQTRLRATHITDHDVSEEETAAVGTANSGVILPYHPFKHSLFASTQNTKNNINAILIAKNRHFIYYPFDQDEWLLILRDIMYEHIFLNFLISSTLYEKEKIVVNRQQYQNNVSYNYAYFRKSQKKYKTHILNGIVFNYKNAFTNNSHVYGNWYNVETKFVNVSQAPFAMNIFCTKSNTGILI